MRMKASTLRGHVVSWRIIWCDPRSTISPSNALANSMTADRWKCEFIMSSYVGAACDSTIRGTRKWCVVLWGR